MRRQSAICIAIVTCAVLAAAHAQAPDPGNYSAPRYQLHEQHDVKVAMRDGVKISVDMYIPDSPEKLPGLLAIWPYDNNNLRSKARWFAVRGYVVVLADDRGRYDSDGQWDPFGATHKTDGYDLVEWMAAQPWSNSKVGMFGLSYGGLTQWWTASAAPPHLAAIVPEVAPPDAFENIPYQDGAINGWFVNWLTNNSGRTAQDVDEKGGYGGWASHQDDLKHTPYFDILEYRGISGKPWFKRAYEQNKSTDEYWAAIAYEGKDHFSKITVPALSMTGWFDPDHPGSPINYMGMKQFGATPQARRPYLIIGPWDHGGSWESERVVEGIDYGSNAAIDTNGYVVRWFDHFLKGIDNGVEKDPPVHVFVMGANKWLAAQDYPLPEANPTKYYFASAGHANSLKGDGLLTTEPPREDASDSYIYDPKNPTRDSFNGDPVGGARDTRLSSIGDEVLVYQTPPLQSPVEVVGPIEATLYAATSARDTDWYIRLTDVQPDGRSMLLADGVLRARNRDPENHGSFNAAQLSTIEPGKVYEYTVRFWRGTGNLFETGHRIRVEISSSWWPTFLANLNTGADNLASVSISEAVVAHQTIHHGPQYPSHILLPVLPAR